MNQCFRNLKRSAGLKYSGQMESRKIQKESISVIYSLTCGLGQSYKHFPLVNYYSRVVITCKLLIIYKRRGFLRLATFVLT